MSEHMEALRSNDIFAYFTSRDWMQVAVQESAMSASTCMIFSVCSVVTKP